MNDFEKIIGIEFKNKELLKRSLTHRSFLNENKDENLKNNERLEFLGDAVLELVVSEHLFHTYPERPEGELTSFRAAVVKTDNLAMISKELGVGNYLLMSKGEEITGGREKDYLLANTFEAVLGAIYLDQGYKVAKDFLAQHLIPQIETIVKYRLDIDAKTELQEKTQKIFKTTPTYKVIQEKGPDHDKVFTVIVTIKGKKYGEGIGVTKQKAEDAAAVQALKKIKD